MNTLHVRDKLKEEHGIIIGRESIRKIFKQLSIPRQKHKSPRRFNRRDRKPMAGMLVQSDGSFHDWFGTGTKWMLIAVIDDATSEVLWAEFFAAETTLNYMKVFIAVIERKGIFWAIYVDRHSVFETTRRDWINRVTFRRYDFDETQMERAFKELGIEMINAHTPQAKGRIERLWKTFQDRLFHELRLQGIKEPQAANHFLQEKYLAVHNGYFAKPPAEPEPTYRPIPDGIDVKEVFCVKFNRVVKNDHTISFESILYKILEDPIRASYARATVEVRVYSDESMKVFYQGRLLNIQRLH